MTHPRTEMYAAARAVLLDAAVVPSNQLFVERFEPIQAGEPLPIVLLGAGVSRVEREGATTKFKGEIAFSVQVVVAGDDGYEGSKARDEKVEEVKVALVAPGSLWPRWSGETTAPRNKPRWEVLRITETPGRGRSEGHALLSSCVLELGVKIADDITDLPEDATPPPTTVVITTKRAEPTDDTGDDPLMITEVTT